MKIGVISDTHGYVHPKVFSFFEDCAEIWHAGDIGDTNVLDELKLIAPVRAVWGNMDDWDVRDITSESLVFRCEEHKVAMMHIAEKRFYNSYEGELYPRTGTHLYYTDKATEIILREKPTIFIGGHSHLLKIMNDPKNQLLFINPGSAARYGHHQRLTFLRFNIVGKKIRDLEIYDEPR